ncbi:MAG: GNAT family N-acetyltransferase [Albidovulum sp.]|uniref:GNAT family N-acetyltransferase n=1 Tax=Albidovulum sp. TaxID=1872424 RepID=UPI001322CA99|nr:GNAT family N-acetyltransferase [Defluviimonas sp.]KAB2882469.1 MAG: GNAT family N-acetyltransferase [Defluviimonas sp.]
MPMRGRGRYRARFAESATDLDRAQALRWRAFRAVCGQGAEDGRDVDAFDALCRHVLVEAAGDGRLVAAFRLLPLADGREIGRSYAAQYYELAGLRRYPGKMVEMGRFCLDPECHDPDVLRVAWAAMTRFVDAEGVGMLFGCSSFLGTDAETYLDAFAMLRERHLAPKRWRPVVKAPKVFRFGLRLRRRQSDPRRAMQLMPPLLRTYLMMGGWVSDHAVVDDDLGTLHVFTGVEIAGIPPARARALRLLAG